MTQKREETPLSVIQLCAAKGGSDGHRLFSAKSRKLGDTVRGVDEK